MPDPVEDPDSDGLIIRFSKITKNSKPIEIFLRLQVIREKVLIKAAKNADSHAGILLRKTAKITFVIDAAESKRKVIFTPRRWIDPSDGTSKELSRNEAWRRTYFEADKVIRAMQRYASFSNFCLKAFKDPDFPTPQSHPNVYFARYVRPVFGTFYKELHNLLVERDRQVPRLKPRECPIPKHPDLDVTKSKSEKKGKGT